MAIAVISVVPLGTSSTSLSKYVANAVRVLESATDVKYELTAMGTIIEGDLERLLSLARQMHQSAFDAGAIRVSTTIKIDERRDKQSSIAGKVASVKRHLETQG